MSQRDSPGGMTRTCVPRGHIRAEVTCAGRGGMAGLADAALRAAGVPVVDGVPALVKLAESLIALGGWTNKIRAWAAPRANASSAGR